MRVSLSYGPFTGHHARDPAEDQDGRDLHDAEPLQTSYTGKVDNDPVNVRICSTSTCPISERKTPYRIEASFPISG